MFKKPLKIGAQNQLSGKDRKNMKSKLSSSFNQVCVEKLMVVNDKIISCKVSGSKMLIYNGNEYPVAVDATGKGDFFPSLYSVHAYQPLIKYMSINEGVESFIYNGANLMWPGVSSVAELGKFIKDEVVCIRSSNGEPIAIGAIGCSYKQFEEKKDINGVAVYILHFKGDKLWDMGPKTIAEVIIALEQEKPKKQEEEANEDKKTDVKQKKNQQKTEVKQKKKKKTPEKKVQKKPSSDEESSSDNQDAFMNMYQAGKKGGQKVETKVQKKPKPVVFSDEEDDRKGKKKGKKQQKKKNVKKEEEDSDDNKKKKGKNKKEQSDNSQEQQQKEEKPKSVISAKLMDQYLRECFLNAIKLSKIEAQLPIDGGRFYIDYMLLARPEGVKLQVKDSSFKKISKFYEQMAKHKIIEFKHNKDKKGQQGSTINKIFWDNSELAEYEPTIFKMNEKEQEERQKEEGFSKKKLVLSRTLKVQTTYKPNQDLLKALFPKKVNYTPTKQEEEQMQEEEEEAKNRPAHFSEQQIRALIQKYINKLNQPKSKKQKGDKADKGQKADKMIPLNFEGNAFLSQLLKKQIEDYQENKLEEEDDEEETEGKKGKKKGKIFRIDRGLLTNKMLKKCLTAYHVSDAANEVDIFAEGTFKGIQLIAQKTNNKNITKIIGLELFIIPKKQCEEQMNGFANSLQQKFACSVNIQNLPGKNAGKQVIVHGNFINELQEMLVNEYGIKNEYIFTQNKLDKKKKKK